MDRRRLDQRLARRPELLERLHQMIDRLEQTVGDRSNAHQAEDNVVDEMHKLGGAVLEQLAQEINERIQRQVPGQHPQAQKKKLLAWLTSLGWVRVEEQQW